MLCIAFLSFLRIVCSMQFEATESPPANTSRGALRISMSSQLI